MHMPLVNNRNRIVLGPGKTGSVTEPVFNNERSIYQS